jgi:hypothetical protein
MSALASAVRNYLIRHETRAAFGWDMEEGIQILREAFVDHYRAEPALAGPVFEFLAGYPGSSVSILRTAISRCDDRAGGEL